MKTKKTAKRKRGCGHTALMHAANGDGNRGPGAAAAYTGCMQPGVKECYCVRFAEPVGWTPDKLAAKCGGRKK